MSLTRPEPIGLCVSCRHARKVRTPRSVFWMCERSKTEPRYPKYPRLPVLACDGYEPDDDARPETSGSG